MSEPEAEEVDLTEIRRRLSVAEAELEDALSRVKASGTKVEQYRNFLEAVGELTDAFETPPDDDTPEEPGE